MQTPKMNPQALSKACLYTEILRITFTKQGIRSWITMRKYNEFSGYVIIICPCISVGQVIVRATQLGNGR